MPNIVLTGIDSRLIHSGSDYCRYYSEHGDQSFYCRPDPDPVNL